MAVGGLFLIGFAWINGFTTFLLSLIIVPVALVLLVLIYFLAVLPVFAIAEAASKSGECLDLLHEMMRTEEEKEAAKPKTEIDPSQLPTWKKVEMLKRGQMVRPPVNGEGKTVCPICDCEQDAGHAVCEKCGMLFFM